jgi:hypothetical protein
LLPLAAERHFGQPVVNLDAAQQREVRDAQLLGLYLLPAVRARIGHRHPGLLGQHLQQEPLTVRGPVRGDPAQSDVQHSIPNDRPQHSVPAPNALAHAAPRVTDGPFGIKIKDHPDGTVVTPVRSPRIASGSP